MRSLIASISLLAAFLPGTIAAQQSYRGICDASAAVALGPNHFVVGEDENDILVVYRRGSPEPVGKIDIIDYLGNRKPNGKPDEGDIEGAARIGGRIYWITSHGRNSDAEVKPTRWRFFATEVVEGGPVPTVRPVTTPPYKTLLQDMIAEGKPGGKFAGLGLAAASEKAPEAPDGLNIEGLAATPAGTLLIGFRNPRPKGDALVVQLMNPAEVIGNGKKPVFGDPIPVPLEQRGIRSMERIGDRYLIAAGPSGGGGGSGPGSDFALYAWAGPPNGPRTPVTANFGKLRPEAMFAIPGTNEVDFLSDDGDEPIDGKPCKKASADKKAFRALTLKLQ